jgi:hypothetical protein
MKDLDPKLDDGDAGPVADHRRGGVSAAAFKEGMSAYRELLTYRYLLVFSLKNFLKRKWARVLASAVALATLVELTSSVIHFPFFPDLGVPAQAALGGILLMFGIAGFWSHSIQMKAIREYSLLLKSLPPLTREISELDFSDPAHRIDRLRVYVQKTLASFNSTFGQTVHDDAKVFSGVLLLLPQANGELVRFWQEPLTEYNPTCVLPADRGAGGWATAMGNIVYVPSVSHGQGIQISEEVGPAPARALKVLKNVFHQFGTTAPPFQSLLCVPMIGKPATGTGGMHAVLYVGSSRVGGFDNEFFLDAARLEANLLGRALETYIAEARSDEAALWSLFVVPNATDSVSSSEISSEGYLRKHLGPDEKWARINRTVWRRLEIDPEHALLLSEIEAIAHEASSELDEVLAVLAVLSRQSTDLLKMEYLDRNSTALNEISSSEAVARLRSWWRDKTMSEDDWKRWASTTIVRWRVGGRSRPGEH